jgi:thiol:disulfide interchange protein DsbD
MLVGYVASMAQVQNPVQWKFEAKKKGANYEIVITAFVNKPWHIYSQYTDKNGALPTKIVSNNNPLVVVDNADKGKRYS